MGIKKQNSKSRGNDSGAFEVAEIPVLHETKTKKGKAKLQDSKLFEAAHPSAISFSDKELLRVLTEVRNGNFGVRIPIDEVFIYWILCDTLNVMISL